MTPILHCALILTDLTSVSACRVFSKVDMKINVQVNISPSTSRYAIEMDTLKMSSSLSNLSGVNQVEMIKTSSNRNVYGIL